ncbi:MAG TPA: HAD family hydrolase [Gaiellales bacterium]|nr:HAD family hydrolase [Gaiellales bacterium]
MSRYRAVLFDAYGTLIRLDRPAARLTEAAGRRWGRALAPAEAADAVRAEIDHYAAGCQTAANEPSLHALRLDCARILTAHIGVETGDDDALALLRETIVLQPYPDAADALDAVRSAGADTAVVSNGDWSLAGALADAGLAVDAVVDSATAGAAKPDPEIFHRALDLLGVVASEALHVGDSEATDGVGARAAGIAVVIVDRSPSPRPGAIGSLSELAGLLA